MLKKTPRQIHPLWQLMQDLEIYEHDINLIRDKRCYGKDLSSVDLDYLLKTVIFQGMIIRKLIAAHFEIMPDIQ